MSYSTCINCRTMVSMYEKYCTKCEKKYNLTNDPNWGKEYKSEFNVFEEMQKDSNPAKVRNETQPKEGMSLNMEDLVYRRIETALNNVRMIHMIDDDGHYSLLDHLCNGSETIKEGKDEIENIIDYIYHELDLNNTLHNCIM